MADDLDDEWWLSNDKSTKVSDDEEEPKHEVIKPDLSSKEKKRKSENIGDGDGQNNTQVKKQKKKQDLANDEQETNNTENVNKNQNGIKLKKKKVKKNEGNTKEIEQPKEKLAKKKRKGDDSLSSPVPDAVPVKKKKQKTDPGETDNESTDKKKKKSKRKKISDVLAKSEPKPLHYTDLTDAITKYLGGDLSVVETDEVEMSEANFVTCHNLADTTADYLQTILPRWNKNVKAMSETPGAPLLLVVCSAATRAVEVIRDLKKFHFGKCKVAKLFAKHMKMKDQTKFLQKSVIHIGVGTPSRISGLLDSGTLSLDQTSVILLDWSWRDAKLCRLIDIKDVRKELFPLLKKHLIPRVKREHCRFALL